MKVFLGEDEHVVLGYLYACDREGRAPRVDEVPLPRERLEAALEVLRAVGFVE